MLNFYYEVPRKDVNSLNKSQLIELLESKFDEEEHRDKAGDPNPAL